MSTTSHRNRRRTPIKNVQKSLASVAQVLSVPYRWTMLREFARLGLVSTNHLAGQCGISRATASNNIRLLKDAGIIEVGMGRLHQLTAAYRPPPGQNYLDFGHCHLIITPAE